MRKNGVNRELIPVPGGVCAPTGFSANAVRCGFLSDGKIKEDLALIVGKKKYPTAFVGTDGENAGAPVRLSRKHIRSGMARAIVVNSGVANAFGGGATELADGVCGAIAKRLRADKDEILIASTGRLGEKITADTFARGLDGLVNGLAATHEKSLAAARAIATNAPAMQLSFSFALGDIACKIGAIFKGCAQVAPNMATTLCFLTTDVDISPEMLQKALQTAVNESLNMLRIDGVCSPNDCACIMASGEAKNWRIDNNDGDYKKFLYALCEVMDKICKELASEGREGEKLLLCRVTGARSKRTAREIAKAVLSSPGLKEAISRSRMDMQSLLCAIATAEEKVDFSRVTVSLRTENGTLVLFEDNERIPVSAETEKRVLSAEKAELLIGLKSGNYAATAYGRSSGSYII